MVERFNQEAFSLFYDYNGLMERCQPLLKIFFALAL